MIFTPTLASTKLKSSAGDGTALKAAGGSQSKRKGFRRLTKGGFLRTLAVLDPPVFHWNNPGAL